MNVAELVRRCIVASEMKDGCLRVGSLSSPSLGGSFGSSGSEGMGSPRGGVGSSTGNLDRTWPSAGCDGMLPLWVRIVIVVL